MDTQHRQNSFPRQNSLSPPLGNQPSLSHRRSSDTTIGIDIGEDSTVQRQNVPKPSLLTLTAPRQARNILSESLHQGSQRMREDVIMTSASSNTTGAYPNSVPSGSNSRTLTRRDSREDSRQSAEYPSPHYYYLSSGPDGPIAGSFESSENEIARLKPGETAGGKKRRSRATQEQLDLLNNVYQRTPFPTTVERNELAHRLGMTPRSVQIW